MCAKSKVSVSPFAQPALITLHKGSQTVWQTKVVSRQAALVSGLVSFTSTENAAVDVAVSRGNQVHILRNGTLSYKVAVPGQPLHGNFLR